MKKDLIQRTKKFVQQKLDADATGHDWWHIERVWKNAKKIAASQTFAQYKKGTASTVHHFHVKLLHLKGLMNTKTAKKLAVQRDQYVKDFLKRFGKEWTGNQ